jgi:hypothetical protein
MRKHRLNGLVLAMLLGTGALTHLPNSKHSSTSRHTTSRHTIPRHTIPRHTIPSHEALKSASRERPAPYPPPLATVRVAYRPTLLREPNRHVHHRHLRALSDGFGGSSSSTLLDTRAALAFVRALQIAASEPKPPPPPPPPPPPQQPASGVWAELRQCESSDNYGDDTGNGYYGAYQFLLSTWEALGFSGLPSQASPATQDLAARELQARSGWGQWPVCARRLGLI